MSHLDEGRILELRDGHLVPGDSRAHLEACGSCQEALQGAVRAAEMIEAALGRLDEPTTDFSAAKAAVRARVAERAEPTPSTVARRRPSAFTPLRRAAVLVLLTAGALSALPGSPLREWWTRPDPVAQAGPASTTESPVPSAAPEQTGVRISTARGPVRVTLRGGAQGTRIELVRSTEPALTVSAPAGTLFATAVDAVSADLQPGSIVIEARWADVATVVLDGALLAEYVDGAWRFGRTPEAVGDDRIVFVVGG